MLINGTSGGSSAKLAELPALEDVPPNERMRLFRQKLKLCCTLYDFSDVRRHVREKEAKRNALLQIVEYISAGKVAWDPSVVADLLECVGANIFRLLGRKPAVVVMNVDGKAEGASCCLPQQSTSTFLTRSSGPMDSLLVCRLSLSTRAVPDEDEPMLEVSWPHMQLVYEILLRFVLSKEVDSKTAKEYFSKKFMIRLLNLFDSEDPRERDYLKVRQRMCE